LNQYEAMFLFDPTFGASFEQCEGEVRRLMERAEAELLFCKKWDERRLAYRVGGHKRGVYVLTYFKANPDKIGGIERDTKLSEDILRVLILRADGVTTERMEQWGTAHGDSRDGDPSDPGRDRDEGKPGKPSDTKSGPASEVTAVTDKASADKTGADKAEATEAGAAEA